MSAWLRPRRVFSLVALTAMWCGLWADISVANIVAGFAIAVAVTALGVGTSGAGGVRIGPLVHLMWLVFVDLVKSTFSVAYEILTPTDYTDESVVAVEVPRASRDHHLLLTVAVTLTPGTAVVDSDPDTGTIYIHLLHHSRRDETVEHVQKLAHLACAALPVAHGEVIT